MSTDARITHAVREVLRDGDPRVRVTHVVREVLRARLDSGNFFLVFP